MHSSEVRLSLFVEHLAIYHASQLLAVSLAGRREILPMPNRASALHAQETGHKRRQVEAQQLVELQDAAAAARWQ